MGAKILLYGAYGYSGKLILDELLRLGFAVPLIAGRDSTKIQKLANAYQLDFACFDVEEMPVYLKKYKNLSVVINAAGPFSATAEIVAAACVKSGLHYLDITGEIEVFRGLQKLNKEAKNAGVMLLPGCGFDVVPTDCLANKLKEQLPDASHLELAFATTGGGLSRGTAKTSIHGMGSGTFVRENGKLKQIAWKKQEKEINFGPFTATCLPIPWGDLETAWFSAKIPNIKVYMPFGKSVRRYLGIVSRILQVGFVNKMALAYVSKNITGPSEKDRNEGQVHIIGKVWNANGDKKKMHMVTPNGYTLTALCTVQAVKLILEGNIRSGFQTPATAYGHVFIDEIKGVSYLSRAEA